MNRKASAVLVTAVLIAFLSACGGGGPSNSPTPIPDCQKNNTGEMSFRNFDGGGTGRTYEIWVEGVYVTTLAPGQVTGYFTFSAGTGTLHLQLKSPPLVCAIAPFVFEQCSSKREVAIDAFVLATNCH